jgi:Rieske Fe-S protein
VADVQAAGALVVGDGSNPYLLAYSGDTVVAHTAICTHQQCAIAASGNCPCHGSEFNVTTGAVIKGPAQRPLAGPDRTAKAQDRPRPVTQRAPSIES